MSDVAIRVEGLGKRYCIGRQERYLALRDVLARAISSHFRWLWRGVSVNWRDGEPERPDSPNPRGSVSQENDMIWALKDVSFSIKRGEVVGIIGVWHWSPNSSSLKFTLEGP